MMRGFKLSLVVAIGTSLVGNPLLHAHGGGGHGGGGGHMGGGHMGGGHMGGGHMGGGHVGGGHYGGGHYGGAHYGHMGGTQHMGTQHMGGVQHMGTQHMGSVQQHHLGTQHLGNVQGSTQHHLGNVQQHSGFSATHQSLNGTHQNFSHLGGTQHLGAQNALGGQHHAPFYQNHALHNANASLTNNTAAHHGLTGSNFTNHNGLNGHNGSQFLSQHNLNGTGTQHHLGGLNQGLNGQGLHHSGNNFLSSHHVAGATSVTAAHHGAFATGQGALNHNHANWNNGLHGNHALYNYHNHPYLNHGNYHRHGNWYGGGGNYWRYPYYGSGFGFGLGFGLGYGLGLGGLGYYGGYGLGYYGGYGLGYYGYGYPCYGYGFGGYGYGLNGYGSCLNGYGYGSTYGNPGWGSLGYFSNCAYQPYSYGYYNNYPGYGYSTYATNGLNGSALAYSPLPTATMGAAVAANAVPAATDTTSGAASGLPTAEQFAQIGETAFKTRDYKGAVRAWRHGLVDDPDNSILVMMLSQALFATEQFSESAGAVQAAMQALPEEKWDVVIKNFRELYGKGEDYTTQLRALEKAAREKPEEPSLRFLLGYHYGFLGYPTEAVKQLEKCVSLAPRDEVAQRVLKLFDAKLPKKNEAPTPGEPPAPGDLKGVPTPIDFVPPPPLNSEPSTADAKAGSAKPVSAAKTDNTTP